MNKAFIKYFINDLKRKLRGERGFTITTAIVTAAVIGGAAMGASAIQANAQKKAAQRAEDLAREQQQQAMAEQKRIEEKYGLTPGELAREQRLFGRTFMPGTEPAAAGGVVNATQERQDFESQIQQERQDIVNRLDTMPVSKPFVGGQAIAPEQIAQMTQRADLEKELADFDANAAQRRQEFESNLQNRVSQAQTGGVGQTAGQTAGQTQLYDPETGEPSLMVEGGLEAQRQSELERRAGMTGEELLREVGPETRALIDQIAARQGMTGEELFRSEGAIPQALYEQVLAETQEPTRFYEDTLNEQLELARQMVNQEANRRGVFGGTPEGGIRFEQLGRAGVDLAIKSAQDKMAYRQQALSNASTLANMFPTLSAAARGEAGVASQTALGEQTGARNELDQYLTNLQNLVAQQKGREANVALGAASTYQPTIASSYNSLMGIEGYRGNIQSPAAAGLGAIRDVAASYVGAQLNPLAASTGGTTPAPGSYEELLQTQKAGQPTISNLRQRSGSSMLQNEFYNYQKGY